MTGDSWPISAIDSGRSRRLSNRSAGTGSSAAVFLSSRRQRRFQHSGHPVLGGLSYGSLLHWKRGSGWLVR